MKSGSPAHNVIGPLFNLQSSVLITSQVITVLNQKSFKCQCYNYINNTKSKSVRVFIMLKLVTIRKKKKVLVNITIYNKLLYYSSLFALLSLCQVKCRVKRLSICFWAARNDCSKTTRHLETAATLQHLCCLLSRELDDTLTAGASFLLPNR